MKLLYVFKERVPTRRSGRPGRQLSARALQRVRRVARTIADLSGSPPVRPDDVAEALGYRGAWR